MLQPLTPRQQEVLELIRNKIRSQAAPPTIREIAATLGLTSTGNVHRIVKEIEKKGYLESQVASTSINLKAQEESLELPPLNDSEAKLYDYLVRTLGSGRPAPSIRDITNELGDISIGSVHRNLKTLEEKNYIVLTHHQAHNIALSIPHKSAVYPVIIQGVPCSAKGFLSPKEGNVKILDLPLATLIPSFVNADAASIFGVEFLDVRAIQGYSKGDYILVRRSLEPKTGDIVAFEYNNRVAVRHYQSKDEKIVLTHEVPNSQHRINDLKDEIKPIEADSHEIKIIGVAVAAIIRKVGAKRASLFR